MNRDYLKFIPVVKVEDKKVCVTFDNLEEKYKKALSNLCMGIVKEAIKYINETYMKLPDNIKEDLYKSCDKDLQNYITVLLTHGEDEFINIIEGTIKIAKGKEYYGNICYNTAKNAFCYKNQPVKL